MNASQMLDRIEAHQCEMMELTAKEKAINAGGFPTLTAVEEIATAYASIMRNLAKLKIANPESLTLSEVNAFLNDMKGS